MNPALIMPSQIDVLGYYVFLQLTNLSVIKAPEQRNMTRKRI